MRDAGECEFGRVVRRIADLDWANLARDELIAIAWSYHYFSIQFREGLLIATSLFETDRQLARLQAEECDTANLSPYPGIASAGERMNHDEFMRRALQMSDIDPLERDRLQRAGERYLNATRRLPRMDRALAIASYEDGGLETVFRAILTAPDWDDPALAAFRHFLIEHIRFDSDEAAGHGALSRHLAPDDRVAPFWTAFLDLFLAAVPSLQRQLIEADAVCLGRR